MKINFRRGLKISLGVLASAFTAVLLVAVFNSHLEMYDSGVHRRLLVSVGPTLAFPVYSGSGERVHVDAFLDGPVVRMEAADRWSAIWFCEDQRHERSGTGATLSIDCAGRRTEFPLAPAPEAISEAPMPDKLFVLSDIEGNRHFLDAALQRAGIVDANGRWTYGEGHLLILGDSVDRGRDVFAVLWTLYRLSLEAQAAGGAVHVLLGNHEQYVLRKNISRAHAEHVHALVQMGGVEASFAADTVIGDWLRTRPVAVKLGNNLFVHAGISRRVLDSGLSVRDLNQASRRYWQSTSPAPDVTALEAVLGFQGVTQFRGLVREEEEGNTAAMREPDVERVLSHFAVERVVVGHTQMPNVSPRFDGKVWAVNVNDDDAAREVLVFESGTPRVLDIGVARELARHDERRLRPFHIWQEDDRRIFSDMVSAMRVLSALPHPY